MGRKINLKKIEDVTKCQVTFSKRRTSLIKKANEIAVCCDVDVALVAFSPSGRVTKYCNKQRIEDVLTRYVNLPPESRLTDIENVQGKMEKLKKLNYLNSDDSKLHFLDKRIENLQLQIKKRSLELQILETNLRDYEVPPEHESASLHQLSWCERNLNKSLKKVIARKMELENKTRLQYSSNINVNELASAMHTGQASDSMMKHGPWTSPYGAKLHGSSSQDLVDQTNNTASNMNHAGPSHMYNFPLPGSSKYANIAATNMNDSGPSHMYNFAVPNSSKYANIAATNMNHAGPSHLYNFSLPESSKYANIAASNVNHAGPSHMSNFPLPDCSTIPESGFTNMTCGAQIPFQRSSMVDPLLKLPDQINADTWKNFSYVSNPNAAHLNTQTSCDFQTPSVGGPQSLYNEITGTSSQFPNSKINRFNMKRGETKDELCMNFGDNLSNPNALNGSIDVDKSGGVNSSQMQQIHAPSEPLQAEKDFCWDATINVALNGNIDIDRSGGMNFGQMQAPSESLPPENDFCWDTNLNGFNDVAGSDAMNSNQMKAPSESLQLENDFCWDTTLNGIIDVDRSAGMNSGQMQQMQAPSGSLHPENNLCWDTTLMAITGIDKSGGMKSSQIQQMQAPSKRFQPEKDARQDTLFVNLHKEAVEQNAERNDSWDWEDLLVTDNFQFGYSSKQ